jgi:hypothetical protein
VIALAGIPESVILVSGIAVVIASGAAATLAMLGQSFTPSWRLRAGSRLLEQERDIAAALGWSRRNWLLLRLGLALLSVALGLLSGIWLIAMLAGVVGWTGVRFGVAGHAARRRLRMERAFLGQVRVIRDRMAIGNQSLDTALQEIGRRPGPVLEWVLRPLAGSGSVVENIVECGLRAGSPLVENVCGVLLWARSRSLDALISIIDEVILPVGEAQLAVEEESLVTLTQQRAVTFAMAALMTLMFVTVLRVDSFRAYYRSAAGTAVLVIAVAMFFGLIWGLGRIVRVSSWTRWDMRRLAAQEAHPHG